MQKHFIRTKAKLINLPTKPFLKIANNYASEDYWGAKALVLLGKNYIWFER
ncbi:hypothetical protein [Chryseobacterium indoltheticum]|uniref:hypothetical protein n=1 Tax=Chryseobacterium indoltheticum TaxID=254 RepID=UPI003F498D74